MMCGERGPKGPKPRDDTRGDFMSNIVDITSTPDTSTGRVRMVMSLNSRNSLHCSLVAQDPFFFDVDPEALEDELHAQLSLDGAYFELPEALKLARETSDGFVTLGEDADGLPLTDDVVALCAGAFAASAALNIDNVVVQLRQSQTASVLLDTIAKDGIAIATGNTVETVMFDSEAKTIVLNAALDDVSAGLLLVRACRQATLSDVKTLLRNPDRAILVNRAMFAELNLVMIQVAWELNVAGDKAAWDAVSASAMADLAYAFGQRACADFRALRDGRAALAAFDQWFYSGRTRKADRVLIQGLLAAGDAGEAAAADVMDVIAGIRDIGDRGIGRNYLAEHIATLLEDGFYGEVRDRSNANFLWFVKFERSYRAAEEIVEAQNDTASHTNGVVLLFPNLKKAARKSRKSADAAAIVPLEAVRP